MGTALRVEELSVGYGPELAVDSVTLAVERGELLALLGPSGSGKTTLLHAVAGFLAPRAGTIWIDEALVTGPGVQAPPERRHIGLVFQNYALWPHMSVLETVAYPMRRQGVPRAIAVERGGALLSRLGLAAYASRRPGQLSGGQQQRVGLARALASAPALFLFDEPTANLDATLKATFQQEIREQQRDTGAGALYVTHDPAEAFSVADRVAVLREGRLAQIGTPTQIYEQPADVWIAGLTGPFSLLNVQVEDETGQRTDGRRLRLSCDGRTVACPVESVDNLVATGGRTVHALIRPDWVHLAPGEGEGAGFGGRITAARFQGPQTDYVVQTTAGDIIARHLGPPRSMVGARVTCVLDRAWIVSAD